jgi:hypothetical protein
MTPERARGGEFTQAVTDHIFGDIDRYVPATIVDGDCVADHLGEDHAGAAPGADNFLIAALVHLFDFLQ